MKKINKKTLLVLSAIIFIAVFLRFWNLDQVPPSLNWDETSWGYNAYSILTTGKDEYGKTFPIVIRSLNDYKPALYAYLTIPAILVFGLTDFAVRFSNAFFGVLTVITTYFLAKELFKRRDIALLSSFLLAISPWSIQFSRFAHEGIVGLEFNLLMALFFIKGLRNPLLLTLSAFFASLSLYSYQNEKVFVPLFGIILIISYWQELFKVSKKYLAMALVVGLIFSLPIIYYTFSTPESFTRAKGASLLNNPIGVLNQQNYPMRNLINRENGDYLGLVIDNRRILYAKDMVGNYLSHFDPNFLFVKGEIIPRHQAQGMGHLYLIELPFLLLGLYFLAFGKFPRSSKKFVFLWILIVPIAASITWDVPNSGRTINFLPTFQMITAIGLVSFYLIIMERKAHRFLKFSIFGIIGIFAVFNFIYYLNQYFVQYNYFSSSGWQYGYNQIISLVNELYPKYDEIIVSNEVPLDQSYIFFLYNLKFPPEEYQKMSSSGEYKTNHRFDKFIFKKIRAKDYLGSNPRQLYISSFSDFPDLKEGKLLREVRLLNGERTVLIVEGANKK